MEKYKNDEILKELIRSDTYLVQLIYGFNKLSQASDIHIELDQEKFEHKISKGKYWQSKNINFDEQKN
ncbi:MAG: hypothetical protein ACNS62_13290 [Candidatus Cyclobacteriaceae bacterium M3_2C_046]